MKNLVCRTLMWVAPWWIILGGFLVSVGMDKKAREELSLVFLITLMILASAFLWIIMFYALRDEDLAEEIRRKVNSLQIPLLLIWPHGCSLPYRCRKKECGGGLARTMVWEEHSPLDLFTKTVQVPSASNNRELSLVQLDRFRRALGSKDRLFCINCGTEYKYADMTDKAVDNGMNLQEVLRLTNV